MKTETIRIGIRTMILVSLAYNSFGQQSMTSIEKGGPSELERLDVPKEITTVYRNEYSITSNESWNGYPSFVTQTDWYGYDPALHTNVHPEYYVVTFENEGTPSKVIYDKAGKKIATYQTFKTDLPKAITIAIGKSKYKTWFFVKDHEVMFRDVEKARIYKVIVEKGTQRRALFFEENGKLVKDKELRS